MERKRSRKDSGQEQKHDQEVVKSQPSARMGFYLDSFTAVIFTE